MERMPRTQDIDDQDCASSVNSSIANDENELFSQNSSQKTVGSQDVDRSDQTKESNEILQTEDLQKMVRNYKQIGGELKSNLKLLVAKWHSLNKTLNEKVHECEMLHQQKDFQMKNLVDLQIKLENLDMQRISLLQDCQKFKSQKTELFTNEMQLLLENYEYIRNTFDKFNEILLSEKQEFENLLKVSKTATEDQARVGEDYYKELQQHKSSYQNVIEALSEQNLKLEEELHQTLEKCKILKYKEMKCKENILAIEEDIKNSNKKHENLKNILEQNKNLLSDTEGKFNKMHSGYEEKLHNLDIELEKYTKDFEKVITEIKEKNVNVAEEKIIKDNLIKESAELVNELSKAEQDLAEKQKELYLLKDEYQLISAKLVDAKSEEAILIEQAEKWSSVTEFLNELKSKESPIHDMLASLHSEILTLREVHQTLQAKEEILQENETEFNKSAEEWLQKLNESESEFSNLLATVSFNCETSSNLLFEKFQELNTLRKEFIKIETGEIELDSLLESTEEEIASERSAKKELLKEKEALNEEVIHLYSMEEEIEALNQKCPELEVKKSCLLSELSALTQYLEENPDIKDLEADLKQVKLEINEATMQHNEQMDTLQMSHQSQKKNLENKKIRELKEIEVTSGKLQARTKKMTDAVPELNQNIKKLEEELKKSLADLIAELDNGLDYMEKLAKYYQKSHKEMKNKSLRAHLLRNITTIDEHLARPMKCMMSLEGIPKISLEEKIPDCYITVISAFKQKCLKMIQESEKNPAVDMAAKLRMLGSTMFGQKWIEPRYPEALNETEISSSTADVYI